MTDEVVTYLWPPSEERAADSDTPPAGLEASCEQVSVSKLVLQPLADLTLHAFGSPRLTNEVEDAAQVVSKRTGDNAEVHEKTGDGVEVHEGTDDGWILC